MPVCHLREFLDRFRLHTLFIVALVPLFLPVFIVAVPGTNDLAIVTGIGDILPGCYALRNYSVAVAQIVLGWFHLHSSIN